MTNGGLRDRGGPMATRQEATGEQLTWFPRDWRTHLRRHWDSGWAGLFGTPVLAWVMPALLIAAILSVWSTPLAWLLAKPVQEIIAPTVAALASATALYAHVRLRAVATGLLAVFVTTIFFRELHFGPTVGGVHLVLIGCFFVFSLRRLEMQAFLADRWVRTWLAGAVLTYVVAYIIDESWVAFLPGFQAWRHVVEETLETCGHVQLFALSLAVIGVRLRAAANTER